MRTDSRIALVVAALLVSSGTAARADSHRPWGPPHGGHRGSQGPGFTVSGIYQGVVDDRIAIDERNFAIPPNLRVYVVGDGLEPLISVPAGVRVSAWGAQGAEDDTILLLVVRPSRETEATNPDEDTSSNVSLRSEDEPR